MAPFLCNKNQPVKCVRRCSEVPCMHNLSKTMWRKKCYPEIGVTLSLASPQWLLRGFNLFQVAQDAWLSGLAGILKTSPLCSDFALSGWQSLWDLIQYGWKPTLRGSKTFPSQNDELKAHYWKGRWEERGLGGEIPYRNLLLIFFWPQRKAHHWETFWSFGDLSWSTNTLFSQLRSTKTSFLSNGGKFASISLNRLW